MNTLTRFAKPFFCSILISFFTISCVGIFSEPDDEEYFEIRNLTHHYTNTQHRAKLELLATNLKARATHFLVIEIKSFGTDLYFYNSITNRGKNGFIYQIDKSPRHNLLTNLFFHTHAEILSTINKNQTLTNNYHKVSAGETVLFYMFVSVIPYMESVGKHINDFPVSVQMKHFYCSEYSNNRTSHKYSIHKKFAFTPF